MHGEFQGGWVACKLVCLQSRLHAREIASMVGVGGKQGAFQSRWIMVDCKQGGLQARWVVNKVGCKHDRLKAR